MSSVSRPVALARVDLNVKSMYRMIRALLPANLRHTRPGSSPRDAAIPASRRLTDSLRFD